MNYVQITDQQAERMLSAVGVQSFEDLLGAIPADIRMKAGYDLPDALSESDLSRLADEVAGKNMPLTCFAGAGSYDHYIPAVVDVISSRGEFLTAYTPYQAEASQGSLQAFFEFQSLICRMTGLDVANASMYEAATALAEAVMMAADNIRRKVIICQPVHPHYLRTVQTYLDDLPITLEVVPHSGGASDFAAAEKLLDDQTAAVVVQTPNFYGNIEHKLPEFAAKVSAGGAAVIGVFDPVSLGIFKRPGDMGVDVAIAEGQPLGMPLSFGGPYLGLMAVSKKFLRKIPGRLIGQTTDSEHRKAYCLTLQTREQHIRRAKATSNICSNQGLCALRASVYLAAMGPKGLANAATRSMKNAWQLAEKLTAIDGVELAFGGVDGGGDVKFFREFVVRCKAASVDEILRHAAEAGILAGVAMGQFDESMADCIMIACTEKRTPREIDSLVEIFQAVCK